MFRISNNSMYIVGYYVLKRILLNRLHTVTITGNKRASVGYEAIFMDKKMFIVVYDLGTGKELSLVDDIVAVAEDLKRVIVGVCRATVFCCNKEGLFSQLVCDADSVSMHELGAAETFKEAKSYWEQNKAQ